MTPDEIRRKLRQALADGHTLGAIWFAEGIAHQGDWRMFLELWSELDPQGFTYAMRDAEPHARVGAIMLMACGLLKQNAPAPTTLQ